MIKYIQIILLMLCLFTQTHACLLTDVEMRSFVNVHRLEIDSALPGARAHKGYRVIAVAYEKMQHNPFDDHIKPDVTSYYASVILSALRGIGLGGLSNKKASSVEKNSALQALYAIGYNLDHLFSFEVTGTSRKQNHFRNCNAALKLGEDYRASSSMDNAAIKRQIDQVFGIGFSKECPICSINLKQPNIFFKTYETAYRNVLEQQERKDTEAMYRCAVGTGDDFSAFQSRYPKASGTSPSSPLRDSRPIVPLDEPWAGTLYRDKGAAEKAIGRGRTEDVCKTTGNLIVRILGKTSCYSSTATLILQNSGVVIAVTNAHCVSGKEGETISSVELHLPEGDVIYFSDIYIHPAYKKNDFDFALLRGKHQKPQGVQPILQENIDARIQGMNGYVVSSAKVNYLESRCIKTLSEQARTLSVQRVERVEAGSSPKFTMPRLINAPEPTSATKPLDTSSLGSMPVFFPPVSQTNHELDAVFSFGCSGSPLYVKVNGMLFLAGLLDSTRYYFESGLPFRATVISSIHTHQEWINRVLMGSIRPSWTSFT